MRHPFTDKKVHSTSTSTLHNYVDHRNKGQLEHQSKHQFISASARTGHHCKHKQIYTSPDTSSHLDLRNTTSWRRPLFTYEEIFEPKRHDAFEHCFIQLNSSPVQKWELPAFNNLQHHGGRGSFLKIILQHIGVYVWVSATDPFSPIFAPLPEGFHILLGCLLLIDATTSFHQLSSCTVHHDVISDFKIWEH